MCFARYFLPVCSIAYHRLTRIFCTARILNYDEGKFIHFFYGSQFSVKSKNLHLNKANLTHLLCNAQHAPLACGNTREHFSTMLGGHLKQQNPPRKTKNLKDVAWSRQQQWHFVYSVRTEKRRQNVAMFSLSWELTLSWEVGVCQFSGSQAGEGAAPLRLRRQYL